MDNYVWAEIDFRPAPDGWSVVYLPDTAAERPRIVSMPGWLIEELRPCLSADLDPFEAAAPTDRHVIAAVMKEDQVVPASALGTVWRVLAPEADTPTATHVRLELERRAAFAETRRPSMSNRGVLIARATAAQNAAPAGSIERKAAGCAAAALFVTRTPTRAREVLAKSQVMSRPVRAAALELLDQLTAENAEDLPGEL